MDTAMMDPTEPISTQPPMADQPATEQPKAPTVRDFSRECDKGDKCWLVRRPPLNPPEHPGCLLVKMPSLLYSALYAYWEGMGIIPVNFPAEQDPDTLQFKHPESSKPIPAWTDGKSAEIEVAVDTMYRAFRNPDATLGGSSAPVGEGPSMEPLPTETELAPALYYETVLKVIPDAKTLLHTSRAFNSVPPHKSQSREHQFFDFCKLHDGDFRNYDDSFMQLHPPIVEEMNPATGLKRRWRGFGEDSHIIGFSGTGKVYVVARENAKHSYRIYCMDATVPDNDISVGLVMKAGPDGKEHPDCDPSKVWPLFREVTVDGGQQLTLPYPPVLTAVSSQASIGSGDMLAMLLQTGTEHEYELAFVFLPYEGQPIYRKVAPPTGGFIPSFIVVSTHSAAVIVVGAKDEAEHPLPPHIWVIPLSPTSRLDTPGKHNDFVIESARLVAIQAPKMAVGEEADGKEDYNCGAYDDMDPHALLIGTHDGGAIRYHVQNLDKIYFHPTAVYFSHTTPREVQIANRATNKDKALDKVGRMRRPVLWMHASDTTIGGDRVDETVDATNILQRTCQRITAVLPTGHSWTLGDRTRVSFENLSLRKVKPFESRVTECPARCCISRGTTVAIHTMIPDSVTVVDLGTGITLGQYINPNDPSIGRVLKPGEMHRDRPFSSLWMDLGRIVVCHPSGSVSFIRKASPEQIKERDEKRREREAKARADHEAEVKRLEEETAKLSVTNNEAMTNDS